MVSLALTPQTLPSATEIYYKDPSINFQEPSAPNPNNIKIFKRVKLNYLIYLSKFNLRR